MQFTQQQHFFLFLDKIPKTIKLNMNLDKNLIYF